jgi:hypothetical protein
MKTYINTNDQFGDIGPVDAESKEALADEMQESFKVWADDEMLRHHEINGAWPERHVYHEFIEQLRSDFIAGLKEVKIDCVSFSYCGHLDEDSKEKAFDIAMSADSSEEAWAEVDLLDEPTKQAICEVGSFRDSYSIIEKGDE